MELRNNNNKYYNKSYVSHERKLFLGDRGRLAI